MEDDYILLYQKNINITIEALASKVLSIVAPVAKQAYVTWRIKKPDTLRKKMALQNTASVLIIKDVYGIRVLVDSVEEAYECLQKIMVKFAGFLEHDYLANPKTRPTDPLLPQNAMLRLLKYIGYENDVPFEIQITTFSFHEINETFHEGYHQRKYNN